MIKSHRVNNLVRDACSDIPREAVNVAIGERDMACAEELGDTTRRATATVGKSATRLTIRAMYAGVNEETWRALHVGLEGTA